MAVDLSVFDRMKTKADYDRANEEWQMKKQLQQAQISKALEVDADKLGEQAFLKSAQGLPLTPQEEAAARFVDAKSGGVMFNPVTGTLTQKPRISDKIGIGGLGSANPYASGGNLAVNNDYSNIVPKLSMDDLDAMPAQGRNAPPMAPNNQQVATAGNLSIPQQVKQDLENQYQDTLRQAAGNPKLTQEIMAAHLKKMNDMDESEAKNAGFADRMILSNPSISDPENQKAANSAWENIKGSVPLVGNYLTSQNYQSAKQAQADFINSILRRESGAAISPAEFERYGKQYFPVPGDTEATLLQKQKNREMALRGVIKAAGPAYQAPEMPETPKAKNTYQRGEVEFKLKKAGYSPEQIKAYMEAKGL